MKIRTIEIPIYFGDLVLIKTNDFQEVNKVYGTEASNDYEAFTFQNEPKGKFYAVFNPDKIDFSVVAHECVHLKNYIFMSHGVQLDLENDETEAYFLEWIFKQIEDFLKYKPKVNVLDIFKKESE